MSDLAKPRPPDRDDDANTLRRILFLDDDPLRAEFFLIENPGAVWVTTVDDCISSLGECWDEVHLDHDLGGEQYVDCEREDCGMAVVRWICREPRPQLAGTRFFVHTHNPLAAVLMVALMQEAGFQVEGRPFQVYRMSRESFDTPEARADVPPGWIDWLRDLGRKLGRFSSED